MKSRSTPKRSEKSSSSTSGCRAGHDPVPPMWPSRPRSAPRYGFRIDPHRGAPKETNRLADSPAVANKFSLGAPASDSSAANRAGALSAFATRSCSGLRSSGLGREIIAVSGSHYLRL